MNYFLDHSVYKFDNTDYVDNMAVATQITEITLNDMTKLLVKQLLLLIIIRVQKTCYR